MKRIVKASKKFQVNFTVKKLYQMFKCGETNYKLDIQRNYVWNSEQESRFIRSVILEKAIPPLFFNKREDDTYDVEDGKQRSYCLFRFLQDNFKLQGLPIFEVINDEGEVEEVDINGKCFSELDEEFRGEIEMYNFLVIVTDNASPEEICDDFYDLNNGKPLSSAVLNRVKAKSRETIVELGSHQVFKEALTEKALEKYTNEDIVAKIHIMLHEEEPSLETKYVRPYMQKMNITNEEKQEIKSILDRIYQVHGMVEDKKVAKRIYTRTHMISIVPIVKKSIVQGLSNEDFMKWFVTFYAGKRSATVSSDYNKAAGSGSAKKDAVRKRLRAIEDDFGNFVQYVSKNAKV